jgi:DNA-directed RNA polymerase subunit K/omega
MTDIEQKNAMVGGADDEDVVSEEEDVASEEEDVASEAEEEADEEADEEEAEEEEAEASEAEGSESEAEASEEEAEASEEEASEAEASEAESEAEEGSEEDTKKKKKAKKEKKTKKSNIGIDMLKTKKTKDAGPLAATFEESDEDLDADDDNYLQKFDREMRDNYILNNHPEARTHNYEEVKALARVSRDAQGIIIDALHKTIPFLTKYEMTRVIGQRAKQLDSGAKTFVRVPLNVIEGYHIAQLELEQNKLPFIIKRPLPNGGIEYWNVSDLEVL